MTCNDRRPLSSSPRLTNDVPKFAVGFGLHAKGHHSCRADLAQHIVSVLKPLHSCTSCYLLPPLGSNFVYMYSLKAMAIFLKSTAEVSLRLSSTLTERQMK